MRNTIHSPLQNEMHPQPVDSTLDEAFDVKHNIVTVSNRFFTLKLRYNIPYPEMNIAMSIQYAYIFLSTCLKQNSYFKYIHTNIYRIEAIL